MYCLRQLEGGKKISGQNDQVKKAEITREINRIFSSKFGDKVDSFKEYTQRLVQYRLEDLNREVKDNKWKIYLLFLQEFLRQNPQNRDLLEKLKFKRIPDDLRHIIWRSSLQNPEIEREYSSLVRTDKVLTVSQFEMNILNETRQFVNKFVSESLFDTSMVQCMKTVLSYVEKKTDIILSDYQYLLCIPLIVAYAELRWLLSQPGELIGQYFSLIAIVKQFDKTAGIRASVDDVKEYETVAQMLETLDRYDPLLREKLEKYMSVEANRKSMSILYRKFVQSLGFSYLNVDSCLFLWDQLFLKVKPLEDDMQLAFVAMILACREEILLTNQFSECAEMIYMKGKATSIDAYISKYI